MSTHADSGKSNADAEKHASVDANHTTLTQADVEMDARIAAYLSDNEAIIAQAEVLLERSRGLMRESGFDPASVMSQLSPAERDALDEMMAKDDAEIEAAVLQEKAAQSFAAPHRKEQSGVGIARKPRLFI